MFQYSTGRQLAHKFRTNLVLDISNFGKKIAGVTTRSYELWRYPIEARLLYPSETVLAKLCTHKVLKRLPLARPWRLFREKHFEFDDRFLLLGDNVYLDGYWQSPRYFDDIEEILKRELSPKIPAKGLDLDIIECASKTNSVAIHIRRGDYVTLDSASRIHGTCSLSYYHHAIQFISRRLSNPNFYVFSDDPEWSRENLLISAPTVYVSHNKSSAYRDLRLIASCKHQIIANSSFSWWGAWLNPNLQKIVVYPKIWFLDNRKTCDLTPKTWFGI